MVEKNRKKVKTKQAIKVNYFYGLFGFHFF